MSFKKLCAFVGSMIIGMIGINTDAHAYKLTEDDCMALATFKEARGEPIIGQAAVIKVILNRMKHREFPSTACGVVFQRTVKVCQFSWACSKVTLPSAVEGNSRCFIRFNMTLITAACPMIGSPLASLNVANAMQSSSVNL
jgi:hypothetical protein